jgi:hypothetical protein
MTRSSKKGPYCDEKLLEGDEGQPFRRENGNKNLGKILNGSS